MGTGEGGNHAQLQKPGRSNPRLFARHARLQKPGRSNPRVFAFSQRGVWLLPKRIIVFPQRLSGSCHTDSLCFPKGCVALATQTHYVVPIGRVAPTAQYYCVFPRAAWLPSHRIFVLCQRAGGSHQTESWCFPKGGVFPPHRLTMLSQSGCGSGVACACAQSPGLLLPGFWSRARRAKVLGLLLPGSWSRAWLPPPPIGNTQ